MRRLLAALVFAGAVACGGGPDNVLTEGDVTGKELTPSRDWIMPVCVVYGKYGCSAHSFIPMHEDAKYYLVVQGQHEGELKTERHKVSIEVYNTYQPGDHVEGLGD